MTVAETELHPLVGTNPLGFLAALGALDVASRSGRWSRPTLRWTEALVPRAMLGGPVSAGELVQVVMADRDGWRGSPVLDWGPGGGPALADPKPDPDQLAEWAESVRSELGRRPAEAALWGALVAEGAVAGEGGAKPTHLHFTAGQQGFLKIARELREQLTTQRLEAALVGPWLRETGVKTLRWDVTGERIYALRGKDPSSEKTTGVPGADWLALLGLRYLPVAARGAALVTTCCERDWKAGAFTWPLWSAPIGTGVVSSLLSDGRLSGWSAAERRALGITRVLRVPIKRSDQGGYGSFGPPEDLPTRSASRRSS